ncbi:transposase, partial [Halorhodospira halochloris]|uniref:transposase n=1 Tax=Halorhodospira halochloris TaxID=1052 RepID=UPI001EE808AE
MGVEVIRTAYRCPWQNPHAERFIRTLQEELLDYIVPLSEKQVNRLLFEYRDYYNQARPHLSLNGSPPNPPRHLTATPAANDEPPPIEELHMRK